MSYERQRGLPLILFVLFLLTATPIVLLCTKQFQ